MDSAHRQLEHTLRFDWGPVGADAIGADVAVAVVVDVLSFTTTLSVALDRGIEVLPYRWRDESAARFAAEHDAALAVGRRAAGPGQVSLSPATVRAARGLTRLVLPSPNGSAIARALAERSVCAGAALRNARAVAGWIAANHPDDAPVSVIAAGERWPDGTLRPAVEDLWGAGAVLAALLEHRPAHSASPEAETAVAAWRAVAADAGTALRRCASGQELIAGGFLSDVLVAAEVDASGAVPVLADGVRFVDRSQPPRRTSDGERTDSDVRQ